MVILHVIVVGFHHTKGYQLEYCYPPFKGSSTVENPDDFLPKEWANLPNYAMPDGSHNTLNGDTVYFVLPSIKENNKSVFGIACYRQIDSCKLLNKDSEVTRSYVQKSVCVLSTVPLYGNLRAKLELITQAYFDEMDFSKVQVLQQMYESLKDLFDYDTLDNTAIYMGLPLSPVLNSFKHRSLELFKLILLEKRIIFEITPTSRLSDVLMGLISLFPCMLEDGLNEAAGYSNPPEASTSNEKIIPEVISVNDYGFPLSLFVKGNVFQPYMSLVGIDSLKSNKVRSYCIGVTNSIFQANKDLYDVYITINAEGFGEITCSDPELEKQLSLTTQDVRFMNNVLKEVDHLSPANFTGNDDWVRLQFYAYLASLLLVTKTEGSTSESDFGLDFVSALKQTHNYRVWRSKEFEMPDIKPSHPCSGPTNAQDLFMHLNRRINNTGQGRKVISTINNTAKYMTEQGSRLKSTFSSWIKKSTSANNLKGEEQEIN